MRTIGLDIATKTGAAIFEGEKLLHWEAHRPRGNEDPEIFNGFRTWLRTTLLAFEIQHGAIEQPLPMNLERNVKGDVGEEFEGFGSRSALIGKEVPMSMKTFLRLYGLFGHAIEIFFALNIPVDVVHQATWRKAFTGNGRADKAAAKMTCQRLGWNVTSADAAEAVGVAFWLRGHLKMQRVEQLALVGGG